VPELVGTQYVDNDPQIGRGVVDEDQPGAGGLEKCSVSMPLVRQERVVHRPHRFDRNQRRLADMSLSAVR
jgi:hypothetical protein